MLKNILSHRERISIIKMMYWVKLIYLLIWPWNIPVTNQGKKNFLFWTWKLKLRKDEWLSLRQSKCCEQTRIHFSDDGMILLLPPLVCVLMINIPLILELLMDSQQGDIFTCPHFIPKKIGSCTILQFWKLLFCINWLGCMDFQNFSW